VRFDLTRLESGAVTAGGELCIGRHEIMLGRIIASCEDHGTIRHDGGGLGGVVLHWYALGRGAYSIFWASG